MVIKGQWLEISNVRWDEMSSKLIGKQALIPGPVFNMRQAASRYRCSQNAFASGQTHNSSAQKASLSIIIEER
jgi:hypothetical protein